MEDRKNIDKGLSLRSEEVNEIMGEVPRRIFTVGIIILSCIVVILVAVAYILQVPSYLEVSYIISGKTQSVGLISKDAGTIMFKYDQPHDIKEGDTIVTVMRYQGQEVTYYTSPISGIAENNFIYVTGDNVTNGDTLARIIPRELSRYRLILKIPSNIKPEIKTGMKITLTMKETTVDNIVVYVKKIALIPDESNCFNVLVEVPMSILRALPTSGKAKIQYKTENLFKQILTPKK